VPLDLVVDELEKRLDSQPDYITLSGSGEPTLFSRIDELIDRIKAMTTIPVAVLTNGSLLGSKDLQRQLSKVDLVIPSLDAGDDTAIPGVEVVFRDGTRAAMGEQYSAPMSGEDR